MADGIRLIVGLGNPEKAYLNQRHNIGRWWVEGIAEMEQLKFAQQSKLACCATKINPTPGANPSCLLAYPTTFMNHSGRAVAAIARFYQIAAEQILIVHDELDLAPGTIKLKHGGGHAGHNGLRDIIAQLGSRDFWRLRIGIGHPGNKSQVSNYVLHPPKKDELGAINNCILHSQRYLHELRSGQWDCVNQALANC